MPENEFLLLVQTCDMFEVVKLDKEFVAATKEAFVSNPIITEAIAARVEEGVELSEVEMCIRDRL